MNDRESTYLTHKRISAVVILLLTLIYLCLELPFSADLLDAVGGVATLPQLQRLEVSGRLISGLAVALLVWQFMVMPWAHRRGWTTARTVAACVVVTFPVMFGVYCAEGMLVDHLAEQGGSRARQTAFATVLFTQGIKQHRIAIRDLSLTDDVRERPDAKAFMALLPLMTSEMSDIRERLMPVAEAIVRNRLVADSGGANQFFKKTYAAALQPVKTKYRQYRAGMQAYNRGYDKYKKGVARYRAAIASASARGDKEYWKYRKYLERKTHSKGPISAWQCPLIRRRVARKYDINLPSDWNCWARAPFSKAVAVRIREHADKKLAAAHRKLKSGRPAHIITTFDAFVRQPAVQNKMLAGWRNSLQFDVPRSVATANQTVTSWSKHVYQPWIDARAQAIVAHLVGHVSDFDPGGAYYERGKAARKLLLIPAMALLFSLLGALTHIVKIIVEASVVIYPRSVMNVRALFDGDRRAVVPRKSALFLRPGLFVVGMMLVACPFWISTPITRSPVFRSIEQVMHSGDGNADKQGAAVAIFSRWTIQAEAIVYPANARLRDAMASVHDFERGWLVQTIADHSKPLSSPFGTPR
ncbi:MAG TPA: hypothetical protein VFJ15_08145 [Oleiagrimonas sp.]|nr:hypothetical protein [Oleiagrimonas sp.]